jgi:hypothetical protein
MVRNDLSYPVNRRVFVAGVLVAAVAVAVAVVATATAVSRPQQGGPLPNPSSHVTTAFPLADGQALTWGMDLPLNPTATDMQVKSIEPVGARGVDVLGIVLSDRRPEGDGRCVSIGLVAGFPPSGTVTREVRGAVLPAADTGVPCPRTPTVLIGVRRSPDSAVGRIDALRMRYEHLGTTYEIVFPFSLDVERP